MVLYSVPVSMSPTDCWEQESSLRTLEEPQQRRLSGNADILSDRSPSPQASTSQDGRGPAEGECWFPPVSNFSIGQNHSVIVQWSPHTFLPQHCISLTWTSLIFFFFFSPGKKSSRETSRDPAQRPPGAPWGWCHVLAPLAQTLWTTAWWSPSLCLQCIGWDSDGVVDWLSIQHRDVSVSVHTHTQHMCYN